MCCHEGACRVGNRPDEGDPGLACARSTEGDFRPKLDAVREQLNAVAEGWTREQKDQCLQETEKSFSLSGALLRTIMTAAE